MLSPRIRVYGRVAQVITQTGKVGHSEEVNQQIATSKERW